MNSGSGRGSDAAERDWWTLRWHDGALELLDQRRLPAEERTLRLTEPEAVARAIEDLVVRGAPAIGCTAAYAVALAALGSRADDPAALIAGLVPACERLAATRPTAVNLFWALERMRVHLENAAAAPGASVEGLQRAALEEARAIEAEDVAVCHALGHAGAPLIPEGARILTHCNAGALATAGWGTALGVVRAAHGAGRALSVYADETRPYLQGARLTAWELARDRIPVTVITDNMAGHLMQRGEIDLVIVGADRVAANGDVANKIGTYSVAVLAERHRVPFYVAAPLSTLDLTTADGSGIPIEERARDEVAAIAGHALLPPGVPVRHPAFDVTPAELVSGIITEKGVVVSPYREGLSRAAQTAP